jgi:hypothetical protein
MYEKTDMRPVQETSSQELPIELVTMHEDLSPGVGVTDSISFANLATAMAHADALSSDERERCFIRHGEKVQTLEEAKRELLRPRLSPQKVAP